jgi:hypothetical protein
MGRGDAIVFLDFDGVLHPGSSSRDEHFMCLPRFEGVIRKFTNVRIVISSSWRYYYSLEQLKANFSNDIRPRIAGFTPLLEGDMPRIRHDEIQHYLARLAAPPGSWIAVDDAILEFPKGFRNLILCDPNVGFDHRAAIRLQTWLEDNLDVQ